MNPLSAAPVRTPSGFRTLHVVSACIASHADKAVTSCRSLLRAYPEIVDYALVVDRPDEAAWAPLAEDGRVRIVDENAVYPRADWRRRYESIATWSPDRSGWYYQQVLKLALLDRIAADVTRDDTASAHVGLLIWDADTTLIRPVRLVADPAGPTYAYCTRNPNERHAPFYLVNAALTGLPFAAHQPSSSIVQFTALSANEALAFAHFLELDPFASTRDYSDQLAGRIAAAIRQVGLANRALFSEYEIVGLFKQHRLASPVRPIRFIRTNNRVPSASQLALMRRCRIAHFTLEGWFGECAPMTNRYLIAQILLQYLPRLGLLRATFARACRW